MTDPDNLSTQDVEPTDDEKEAHDKALGRRQDTDDSDPEILRHMQHDPAAEQDPPR